MAEHIPERCKDERIDKDKGDSGEIQQVEEAHHFLADIVQPVTFIQGDNSGGDKVADQEPQQEHFHFVSSFLI